MDRTLKAMLQSSGVGKWPPGGDFYLHFTALGELPKRARERVYAAGRIAGEPDWNVVKFGANDTVSLLLYPTFDEQPHPALYGYVNVDVDAGRVRRVQAKPTKNPSILHRKESFVAPYHPQYAEWLAFSELEEAAGLLGRSDIGTVRQWEAFLASRGFKIEGDELLTRNAPRTEPVGAGLCTPKDYVGMGSTFRIGIGLPSPKAGETWTDVAVRGIERGEGPLIARFVAHHLKPRGTFLDFGCGAAGLQVRALRELGYNIVGYEWPPAADDRSGRTAAYLAAVEDGVIDPDALKRRYDYVLASNVMNVQPTWACFDQTTTQLTRLLKRGGTFVCNLASDPRRIWEKGRKGDLALETELQRLFRTVVRHEKSVPKKDGKPTSDFIWTCKP
jgi:predicted Rdx family selenoprotein